MLRRGREVPGGGCWRLAFSPFRAPCQCALSIHGHESARAAGRGCSDVVLCHGEHFFYYYYRCVSMEFWFDVELSSSLSLSSLSTSSSLTRAGKAVGCDAVIGRYVCCNIGSRTGHYAPDNNGSTPRTF